MASVIRPLEPSRVSEDLDSHPITLTADIVASYVSNNSVTPADLPALIQSTFQALVNVNKPQAAPAPELVPAVSVKKSVSPDYLISLEDGRKYKSLRRHLGALGMTPDEYRTKWGLSKDYPMVAANYSAQRSNLAKTLGLGRRAKEAPAVAAKPAAPPKPPKPPAKAAKAPAPAKAAPAGKRGGKAIKPEDETFS